MSAHDRNSNLEKLQELHHSCTSQTFSFFSSLVFFLKAQATEIYLGYTNKIKKRKKSGISFWKMHLTQFLFLVHLSGPCIQSWKNSWRNWGNIWWKVQMKWHLWKSGKCKVGFLLLCIFCFLQSAVSLFWSSGSCIYNKVILLRSWEIGVYFITL